MKEVKCPEDIIFDYYYVQEEKYDLANIKYRTTNNEELKKAYDTLMSSLVDKENELKSYTVLDKTNLTTYELENIHKDYDCSELDEIFGSDNDFKDCLEFYEIDIRNDMQCTYCKLYHLNEMLKDNPNKYKLYENKL